MKNNKNIINNTYNYPKVGIISWTATQKWLWYCLFKRHIPLVEAAQFHIMLVRASKLVPTTRRASKLYFK